jgi:hypothetical protein
VLVVIQVVMEAAVVGLLDIVAMEALVGREAITQ